jgi:hypothetical protein
MSTPLRYLARSYAAGRKRISVCLKETHNQLNRDRARYRFLERLREAELQAAVELTAIEAEFCARIIRETDFIVPELFSGDANICDSLRRKYAQAIKQSAQPSGA